MEGYSIQGYTIEGLSRLQNTRHEIHVETREVKHRKKSKKGLEHGNSKLSAEQVEWLKANFATMKACDMEKVLKVTRRTITNYARRLQLVKDKDLVRFWRLDTLSKTHDGESLRKQVENRKKAIEADKRRILYGLEQKTKYKLGSNRSRLSLKFAMKKRHGYESENGSNVIYYTDETRRSAVQEKHAVALGYEIRKK